jgi:acyl-CoA thioesterase I
MQIPNTGGKQGQMPSGEPRGNASRARKLWNSRLPWSMPFETIMNPRISRRSAIARIGLGSVVLLVGAVVPSLRAVETPPTRTIVFFGDSLTAGYGLPDPETESYPALIQGKIDAAHRPWHVVNAGVSGETSAGGLRRIDWVLRQKVDVFVLELGANDGLRGISPDSTRANLQAIIDRVRSICPGATIVLVGMRMPASMGPDFAGAFHAIFPALASKNGLVLIPFLLEGVAGRLDLNQGDGIHPTAQGTALVAEVVWKTIEPTLALK